MERPDEAEVGDLDAAFEAFRTVQAFEAWQVHGPWLTAHPGAVSGAVAARFRTAAAVEPGDAERARAVLAVVRQRLLAVLAERTLLLPSTASPAPPVRAAAEAVDAVRVQTLRLTCLAGIAGAPALSAPALTVAGGPVGLGLIGAPHSDPALIRLAEELVGPGAQPNT
jgi:Asp-tRNA(Asn)/Glu-tRNA(Gln) amidotransferase A subunit family amidase